jgi:hypothetical protein
MGFIESGSVLRERSRRDLSPFVLPTIKIAGHWFAFTIQSVSGRVEAGFPSHKHYWDGSDFKPFSATDVVYHFAPHPQWSVRGIEIDILQGLGPSIASGSDRTLLQIGPLRTDGKIIMGTFRERGTTASVFSDGTFFATIIPHELPANALRYRLFKL